MSERKKYLGNEWKDWDGEVNTESDATIGLFLLLSIVVLVIFSLILLTGQYLIYPRLASLHRLLPVLVQTFILGVIGFMIAWILLLSLSMFFNINLLMGLDKKVFNILKLFPHTKKLAKRFGINRDRLNHSFIKMNNKIVTFRKHNFSPCDLMVLLPRCLNKDIHTKTKKIADNYNIKSFVVAGGEAAREIIKQHRPKAVIAVACERDLVAGIKDVRNLMVLGVPNKRPEGPCKNTCIDLKRFENSIRLFLGLSSNVSI